MVVGITSNGFILADPNDRGMIDVVGFDIKDAERQTTRAEAKVSARALDWLELPVVSLEESININSNYGNST